MSRYIAFVYFVSGFGHDIMKIIFTQESPTHARTHPRPRKGHRLSGAASEVSLEVSFVVA